MSDGTSRTAAAQNATHLVSRLHQHGLCGLGELRCIFSVANENREESRTLSSRAFGRKVMGHVTSGYSAYSKLRVRAANRMQSQEKEYRTLSNRRAG